MPIYYNQQQNNFHICTNNTSYIIHLVGSGYLQHVYWGKRLRELEQNYYNGYFNFPESKFTTDERTLDLLPQEYPCYGTSDYRSPAFQVQMENGSTISSLEYAGHTIYDGKMPLEGLPACYVEDRAEAQTLEISLIDKLNGLKVVLSYTAYSELDAITRSVKLVNEGSESLRVLRALTASVDFCDSDFEMLQLSGAWGRECQMIKRPLVPGVQSIDSKRTASSAQQNPFMALMRKGADEDKGEVYGFNFVYSGNFFAGVEVDQYGKARAQMGMNPFDFTWLLNMGEGLQLPEVVMVYSDSGLGEMSRIYHRLYRKRLVRGVFRDQPRPVLINSWEVSYFDVSEARMLELAERAAGLGFDLIVMDDGWFGKRNDSKSSLGDWFEDPAKLPGGLKALAENITKNDIEFGLWVEPEMVSPDSDLYRSHPEWCVHVPGRHRSTRRNQLVLDLANPQVSAYIIDVISKVLACGKISYVKWDMNRHITEAGSPVLPAAQQREISHRYILNLYRILDTITARFPNILFEDCASGGGRFDPGMLYYMPQAWVSDNTDAVDRIRIQYGTSIVYPAITMCSHVTEAPNHQIGRVTPMQTRGYVAMGGNMGYEFDITKSSQDELNEIKEQVACYKEIRHIVQFGDMYRLINPFEGNEAAWMFVTEDKKEAAVFHFRKLAECDSKLKLLKLRGLDANSRYAVSGADLVCYGDELQQAGLMVTYGKGDFHSRFWHLKAVD